MSVKGIMVVAAIDKANIWLKSSQIFVNQIAHKATSWNKIVTPAYPVILLQSWITIFLM